MKATLMFGAGDVRIADVPEPTIKHPTDAIVRTVRACVCGSDLHPYHNMPRNARQGRPRGFVRGRRRFGGRLPPA